MSIELSLFQGKLVYFSSLNLEADPAQQARWMQDSAAMRLHTKGSTRPLSAARMKRRLEKIEKEQEEKRSTFYFNLRTLDGERLVGYARLFYIEWTHSTAFLELLIGDAQDRSRGYGSDALQLLLRYAFAELNLHRAAVEVPAYNPAALRFFQKAGFTNEVCRRQALYRDFHAWDLHMLGLLQDEWQARQAAEADDV